MQSLCLCVCCCDLSTSTFSSSSDCLMRMEIRTELTLPSIKHFSCSLRAITTGASNNSLDNLHSTHSENNRAAPCEHHAACTSSIDCLLAGLLWSASVECARCSRVLPLQWSDLASTSGLLCLSTTCDAKLRMLREASRVTRMALRYPS